MHLFLLPVWCKKGKLSRFTDRKQMPGQIDKEIINTSGLSRMAAPALITEQASREEVCCLSPTTYFRFQKQLVANLVREQTSEA